VAQQLRTDRVLFTTTVLMVCFGLVMVYSASSVMAGVKHQDSEYYLLRQAGWAVVAFLSLMFFKRLDYHKLANPVWAFGPLGIVTALLVVVYFLDTRAHRWIRIGSVGLQPAEFAKPALILFLAWFLTRRSHAINTRHTLAGAALILLVLSVAMIDADLGTTVVCMVTAGAVLYVAGVERRYFITAAVLAALVIPAAIVAKPYRMLRVISYVDPEYKLLDKIDPKGWVKARAKTSLSTSDAGYQGKQSRIAVATGGVLGVGMMESKQKLFYLPEAHNDFIYAVVAEELGFWGATAVVIGYVLILWRGFRLYFMAQDDFGK